MFRTLGAFEIRKADGLSVGSHSLELPSLHSVGIGSSHEWFLRSSATGEEIRIGPGFTYYILLGDLNTYPTLIIRTTHADQWITAIGSYST